MILFHSFRRKPTNLRQCLNAPLEGHVGKSGQGSRCHCTGMAFVTRCLANSVTVWTVLGIPLFRRFFREGNRGIFNKGRIGFLYLAFNL